MNERLLGTALVTVTVAWVAVLAWGAVTVMQWLA